MMSKLLPISLLVALSACTSQELYNHTQMQVKINCHNKVGIEREQCLEQINTKSYDDYEAERQKVIKYSTDENK